MRWKSKQLHAWFIVQYGSGNQIDRQFVQNKKHQANGHRRCYNYVVKPAERIKIAKTVEAADAVKPLRQRCRGSSDLFGDHN